jgi:peptide-methionine (S)-S-oxide reductase
MTNLGLLCCALLLATSAVAQQSTRQIPPPSTDDPRHAGDTQSLVLAGGCYWGMQSVFEHVRGVKKVVAGFSGRMGGGAEDQLIKRPQAAAAESVQIAFDPAQITYGQILQIYFSVAHDPTEVDRQGPDVGPQYRSVIYYADDEQKKIADAYIAQLQSARVFSQPIATQVEPLVAFHAVGESQQDYVLKNPTSSYVVGVDVPKLAALRTVFPAVFADPPITYSSASD